MSTYLLFKVVHLLAVVAFLGNIATGLFWMKWAYKSNNTNYMHHTVSGIIASDKLFTIPGVIILTTGGIAAAVKGGLPLLSTGWIFWSLILFSLSGIFFTVKVAPLQKKIFQLTGNDDIEKLNHNLYRASLKQWEMWGFLALLTPLAALVMMVLKIPIRSGL